MTSRHRFFLLISVVLGALFLCLSLGAIAQEGHALFTSQLQKQADARLVALWTNSKGEPEPDKPPSFTVQAVRKALDLGADVNARDKSGQTALMAAARFDFPASDKVVMAQMLLDRGADVNAHDDYHRTALFVQGSAEFVQLILSHGADVNAKDNEGNTVLMYRSADSPVVIVKDLLDHGADVNAHSKNGNTALIFASGDAPVVKLLLERGADANARNNAFQTALSIASYRTDRSSRECVKLLKAAGATLLGPPLPTRAQRPTLTPEQQKQANAQFVSLWGDTSSPTNSHSQGLNLDKIYDQMTPLSLQQALEAGADIDAKDTEGNTLLWLAARVGYDNLVKLLLAAGADIHVRNNDGETPLLAAAGGPIFSDLGSNFVGYPELVTLLLNRGAEINAQDHSGATALTVAARSGEAGIVRLLLAHGANVNVRQSDGITPLMAALAAPEPMTSGPETGGWITGNTEVIHLLLTHGAKVHAKDNKGQTVLDWVTPAHMTLVDGATIRNPPEKSAINRFVRQHRLQIIRMLQAAGAR